MCWPYTISSTGWRRRVCILPSKLPARAIDLLLMRTTAKALMGAICRIRPWRSVIGLLMPGWLMGIAVLACKLGLALRLNHIPAQSPKTTLKNTVGVELKNNYSGDQYWFDSAESIAEASNDSPLSRYRFSFRSLKSHSCFSLLCRHLWAPDSQKKQWIN